jgi:hypothetical protein
MSQAESTFITSLFWSARLLYCCGPGRCHPDRYGPRPMACANRTELMRSTAGTEGNNASLQASTRNLLAKRESFGRLKQALSSMVAAIANI